MVNFDTIVSSIVDDPGSVTSVALAAEFTPTTGLDAATAGLIGTPTSDTRAAQDEIYARPSYPIPLGSLTAWSAYVEGSPTLAIGNDGDAVGDYVRVAIASGDRGSAGRDITVRLDQSKALSCLIRPSAATLSTLVVHMSHAAHDLVTSVPRLNKAGNYLALTPGRWHRLVLHPQERDAIVGATPAVFGDLRALTFRPMVASGDTLDFDITDLQVHQTNTPGSVTIMFDDARDDNYTTAFPMLEAYGWPGTIAVDYSHVDSAGFCTTAQLAEMYAAGWDMTGHGASTMTALTEAQQIAVYRASKAWLYTNGFLSGSDIWVWPGGARDAASEEIASRYYRTLRRVYSLTKLGIPDVYDPIDPPYFCVDSQTLATVKGMVDRVAASGGHVTLGFHSIVDSIAAPQDWLTVDFAALLAHVAACGVRVVPASHVWTA